MIISRPGYQDPQLLPVVPTHTQLPSQQQDFQANLPVATQMDVWRPNWPHEVNSTTKTITGR